MRNKYVSDPLRVSVYAEGKRAFKERMRRAYNPYVASNLALAASWWHGWDTAEEEESKDKRDIQPGSNEKPAR